MGYTSQQFLLYDNSTDANYRSWGSAISAAISAMGWAQTADPQINWTTVTSPASGAFNYEIWKPGDALTAFYLKVGYGSSTGSPKGCRLTMQIGTGADGSGNLTGYTTSVFEGTTASLASGNTVKAECDFSGDTNRLGLMLWRTYTAPTYCVERTKNTDGTDSSDGVTIVAAGSNAATGGHQTVFFASGAGIATAAKNYIALSSGNNASQAEFNNVPVSPCFPSFGRYLNPLTTVAFVHSQDVAEGCLFSTTLYGATRTYLATGNATVTAPANCKLCMRYD
jgi:hypothetical protein